MNLIYTLVSVFIFVFAAVVVWMIATDDEDSVSEDREEPKQDPTYATMLGLGRQIESEMYKELPILSNEADTAQNIAPEISILGSDKYDGYTINYYQETGKPKKFKSKSKKKAKVKAKPKKKTKTKK